jgi:hypothetical protein
MKRREFVFGLGGASSLFPDDDRPLEHDTDSPARFPDHATFFLGGAPEQLEPLRQIDEADIQTGAARRVVNDRAIDNRLARSDDYLSDLGYLAGGSNPCKSAGMNHLELRECRYSRHHNAGTKTAEK